MPPKGSLQLQMLTETPRQPSCKETVAALWCGHVARTTRVSCGFVSEAAWVITVRPLPTKWWFQQAAEARRDITIQRSPH
mmetsp:Transcript_16262/g.31859  ORF Transcript_16262/g.31859 Transcript_16262/m.31859 type:complete len:80 (-) Transcript_16262:372-611(-)